MTTFVALLRAVNVSGRNRLPMAELRERLEAAGFARVRTYLQSGNLVFAAKAGEARVQEALVHEVVARDFALDVTVIAFSAGQFAQVAAGNALAGRGRDDGTLHTTFLSVPVSAAAFDDLALPASPDERAILNGGFVAGAASAAESVAGRAVYLHLPHGYGRTKLNNAFFERVLGAPATTRNWRTVLALADMSAP